MKGIHQEVLRDIPPLTVVTRASSSRTRQEVTKKEGARAQQERSNPEGLGSRHTLLSSHRPYQAA